MLRLVSVEAALEKRISRTRDRVSVEEVQDSPRNGGWLADVRCGTNPSREGRRRRDAQNMAIGQRLIFDAIRGRLLACREAVFDDRRA